MRKDHISRDQIANEFIHTIENYPSWMSEAECKYAYHTPFNEGDKEKFISEYCSECPVIQECFDYAVKSQIISGVWGGKIFPLE